MTEQVPFDDLPPEDQRRLEEARKAREKNTEETKKLSDSVRELAQENRGKKSRLDTSNSFTNTILSQMNFDVFNTDELTAEVQSLFDQVEEINKQNRTSTKAEQRASLKQLEVLQELSDEVGNPEQREQLKNFIEMSQTSVKQNATRMQVLFSSLTNNLDAVSVAVSALNDSPALAFAAGFLGDRIKGFFKARREQKFAVQEGKETLLRAKMEEGLKLQQRELEIQEEIAQRLNEENNSPIPENENNSPIPEPTQSTEPQPVVLPENFELEVSSELGDATMKQLDDMLSEINYELIEVKDTIKNCLDSNFDRHAQLLEEIDYDLISLQETMKPFFQNSEENKRESERYNKAILEALQGIKAQTKISNKNESNSDNNITGQVLAGTLLGKFGSKIAAIGAGLLGALSIKNLKETMKKIGNGVKNLFKKFKGKLLGFGKLLLRGFTKFFLPFTLIEGAVKGIIKAVTDIFEGGFTVDNVLNGVRNGFLELLSVFTFGLISPETIDNWTKIAGEFIADLIFDTVEYIKGAWTTVKDTVFNFGGFLLEEATKLKDDILKSIKDKFNDMVQPIKDFFDRIFSIDFSEFLMKKLDGILPDNVAGDWLRDKLGLQQEQVETENIVKGEPIQFVEGAKDLLQDGTLLLNKKLDELEKVTNAITNTDQFKSLQEQFKTFMENQEMQLDNQNNEPTNSGNLNVNSSNISNNTQQVFYAKPEAGNPNYQVSLDNKANAF